MRIAIVLWVGLTLVSAIKSVVRPHSHTVYPIYSFAAGEWLAERSPYVLGPAQDYFRYSPVVAAFFGPWQWLGDGWGGALWRILGTAICASGLAAWIPLVPKLCLGTHCLRSSASRIESGDKGGERSASAKQCFAAVRSQAELGNENFGLIFCLVWPFLLQNVNNAQANVHLIGLLLWGTADLAAGRHWRAAAAFALACVLKPYAIALVLLIGLIEPRMLARFVAVLFALLALPFALKSPSYVADQYAEWFRLSANDDRSGMDLKGCYRDLPLLFRMYLVPLPTAAYRGIEVFSGLAMAGLVFTVRRQADAFKLAFALGTCWMTVLGPATESCTYLLLAPSLAAAVIANPGPAGLAPRLSLMMLVATICASAFPQDWRVQALGLQPAAGLLFLGFLMAATFRRSRCTTRRSDESRAA